MLGFKAVGATLLPFASLRALLGNFLLPRALLLNWLTGLTLIDSLVAVVLLLAPGLLRVLILLLLRALRWLIFVSNYVGVTSDGMGLTFGG